MISEILQLFVFWLAAIAVLFSRVVGPSLEYVNEFATLIGLIVAGLWFLGRHTWVPRGNLNSVTDLIRLTNTEILARTVVELSNTGHVPFEIESIEIFFVSLDPLDEALDGRIRLPDFGVFDDELSGELTKVVGATFDVNSSEKKYNVHPGEVESWPASLLLVEDHNLRGDKFAVVSQVRRRPRWWEKGWIRRFARTDLVWRHRGIIKGIPDVKRESPSREKVHD